ncbi:hypothetical protein [Pseudopontixanthobacter vadosimaris]|uniref:hypothetical protein n=1 Tax=Pseudopontixanthobacter vadosimaris TaxID=2726450 RepID=UPI001474C4DF|nr:hypothetical protein [Pseudopontixanthobacter vadosimaris]
MARTTINRPAPFIALAALAAGSLALAACDSGQELGETEVDAVQPADAPDAATGITAEALEANQIISRAGVLAQQLSQPAPLNDEGEWIAELQDLVRNRAADLPDGLAARLMPELDALVAAHQANDEQARRAAAQAIVVTLRQAAPVGGEV